MMLATAVQRSQTNMDASPGGWTDVCALDDVLPGTGGAALVEGMQIAIVRTRDGRVFALSNFS